MATIDAVTGFIREASLERELYTDKWHYTIRVLVDLEPGGDIPGWLRPPDTADYYARPVVIRPLGAQEIK